MEAERRDSLRKAADETLTAANELSRGALNLWKARLNAAIELGDEAMIRDIMTQPGGEAGLWDTNTNCGGGCGGGGGGPMLW